RSSDSSRPRQFPPSGARGPPHRRHRPSRHRHQPPATGPLPTGDTMTLSINDLVISSPGSTCDADLAKSPWEFDGFAGYGPGASEDDVVPAPVTRPGQLPAAYQRMPEQELHARIRAAKQAL